MGGCARGCACAFACGWVGGCACVCGGWWVWDGAGAKPAYRLWCTLGIIVFPACRRACACARGEGILSNEERGRHLRNMLSGSCTVSTTICPSSCDGYCALCSSFTRARWRERAGDRYGEGARGRSRVRRDQTTLFIEGNLNASERPTTNEHGSLLRTPHGVAGGSQDRDAT